MNDEFLILPLQNLKLEEILPIVTGYESTEKFAVEKLESDSHIHFNIQLVNLREPHRANFEQDFNAEDLERYLGYLQQGYSFGVYIQGRLVAFAICQAMKWNNSLQIWEFQVMQEYRRRGLGRALMQHVVDQAIRDHFRIVYLETQNTNVKAIRFYRKMGFSLDALDLSYYTNHDVEDGEIAFFMKKKLE